MKTGEEKKIRADERKKMHKELRDKFNALPVPRDALDAALCIMYFNKIFRGLEKSKNWKLEKTE